MSSTLETTETAVAVVGAVQITGPGSKGYYRLKWVEPNGRPGDTTGSTDLERAIVKATEIDHRVGRATGPKAVTAIEVMVKEYLAVGRSPYKGKRMWKSANKTQITRNLCRCIRGFGHYRAMDVDRDLCDQMRAQAGTENMVSINTRTLRSFFFWGYQQGYLTSHQAELLPRACSMPAPALKNERRRIDDVDGIVTVRMNGQADTYVRDEDAPSRGRVVALGRALAVPFPAWGELAAELAAASGPRWGEQFQLTAFDAHPDGCTEYAEAHVHVEWQVDSGGAVDRTRGRRVRPKGDKTRVIPVPTLSFTGYRLRDALRLRVAAAIDERDRGENPEALLFPAAKGGMHWHSSFNSDYLLPAMEAGGWPVERWEEERDEWDPVTKSYRMAGREIRKAGLPWHSLRSDRSGHAEDARGRAHGDWRLGEHQHSAEPVLPQRSRQHAAWAQLLRLTSRSCFRQGEQPPAGSQCLAAMSTAVATRSSQVPAKRARSTSSWTIWRTWSSVTAASVRAASVRCRLRSLGPSNRAPHRQSKVVGTSRTSAAPNCSARS